MKIQQIAVQIYTVRDHLKIPKDITATVQKTIARPKVEEQTMSAKQNFNNKVKR